MNRTIPDIPTSDPAAALDFCQRLAAFLQAQEVVGSEPVPELSVVMPVHNEIENLPAVVERLSQVGHAFGAPWEAVFIDDGSTDGSGDYLVEQAGRMPNLRVVQFTRNFGHQVAISAGLEHARGRAVVVMDADLQDPPEFIPDLVRAWRAGNDVVYAVRKNRKESWIKRQLYSIFYRLLRKLSDTDMPLDAGDFCLMDRKVVDHICRMPERTRFVRGLRSWVGLRQTGLPYDRQARNAGQPTYTFRSLLSLAFRGIFSFSRAPLHLAVVAGLCISALSIALAVYYVIRKFTVGLYPPGFATLVTTVLFLSGVNLVMLGVVGEYVGRVFDEVRRRPLYLVRRVAGGSPSAGHARPTPTPPAPV